MAETEKFTAGLPGHDVLVHVALAWGDTAVTMLQNETLPSVRLFLSAAEAGVKNIIYTSSIAVFGTAPNNDAGPVKPSANYGATKGSAEAYLMAIGSEFGIRVNVVRPGYTFGNPVVEGAYIYSDKKIKDMVKAAQTNAPMSFVKNDGTQFIWAGDLAKIYSSLLESDINRGYYTGVGAEWRQWGDIAQMAVELLGSTSAVSYEDKSRAAPVGLPIDISNIVNDFGYKFKTDEHMKAHIKWLAENLNSKYTRY